MPSRRQPRVATVLSPPASPCLGAQQEKHDRRCTAEEGDAHALESMAEALERWFRCCSTWSVDSVLLSMPRRCLTKNLQVRLLSSYLILCLAQDMCLLHICPERKIRLFWHTTIPSSHVIPDELVTCKSLLRA